MDIRIRDWLFSVDVDATFAHTTQNAGDHCLCGYCRNYYDCVDIVHPQIRGFLSRFGAVPEGPSELMPFAPTLLLAAYRITGTVVQWGESALFAGDIPVTVEVSRDGTFLLWVGELELPWCQEEPVEDVVSPANTPEFLEHMQQVWYMRHGEVLDFS